MNYNGKFYKLIEKATKVFSNIHWTGLKAAVSKNGKYYSLTEDDHAKIKEILASGYFLILNNRNTHLSTYLIGFASFVKTGVWPDYAHILMNLDVGDVTDPERFDLMEATNSGVHYSEFMEVFDCDSVCIIRPKNLDAAEWEKVMVGLGEQLGKKYDNWFDLKDTSRVSCVEMCLEALKESPTFEQDFPNLSAEIKKVGNLTPQMYRDCPDFEVIFEVKRK